MSRIAVLGSLHMDILVNAPDRPRKGETLSGTHWALRPGGKGGNQAVQAAQQGAQVHMIGRVGNDDFGTQLVAALTKAGVNADFVSVDETAGSGMSVAIIDQKGDYGAVIVSGANRNIAQPDIERASHILLQSDALILQYEIPLDTVREVARFAHSNGVRVILNAAPAYPTDMEMLQYIDVLIVNEIEAEMLSGHSVADLAQAEQVAQMLGESVPTVLITLGGNGVMVYDKTSGLEHVPGYKVEVIDMHGAGDAFIGAFAARLVSGDNLLDAVRYANATGALMVMHAGPQSDSITTDRVREFMLAH